MTAETNGFKTSCVALAPGDVQEANSTICEVTIETPQKKSKKEKKEDVPPEELAAPLSEPENDQNESHPVGGENDESIASVKSGRKRRRKRKSHHLKEALEQQVLAQGNTCAPVVPQTVHFTTAESQPRKHIRFDADNETGSQDVANSPKQSYFPPPKSYEQPSIKVVKDNSSRNVDHSPKQSHFPPPKTYEQQSLVKPVGSRTTRTNDSPPQPETITAHPQVQQACPPMLNALLSLRSAVFSRPENDSLAMKSDKSMTRTDKNLSTEALSITQGKNSQLSNNSHSKIDNFDPTTCPLLNGPPRVGDVIAYKVSVDWCWSFDFR